MSMITDERRVALHALNQFITSQAGRDTLKANGYVNHTPILPADEAKTVASVMARVRLSGSGTAVIAFHFPNRQDTVALIELTNEVEDVGDADLTAGDQSTIGMLADAVKAQGLVPSRSIRAECALPPPPIRLGIRQFVPAV